MPKAYLLSRTLDPLLGIFTGFLAFHLNETNPRTAPPSGHTLRELASWKWEESKKKREGREGEDAVEWERITKELVGGEGAAVSTAGVVASTSGTEAKR